MYALLLPILSARNNQVEEERRKVGRQKDFILQTYPCVFTSMLLTLTANLPK